jgi:PmbA protein
MENILENAKKVVDDAEVFWINGRSFPIKFKANRFYTAEKKDFDGLGIRVIDKGRLGFSHTTKMETSGAIIDFAKNTAKYGERAHFTFPKSTKVKELKIYRPILDTFDSEKIRQHCREVIGEIQRADKDAKVDIEYKVSEISLRVMNTQGLDVSYKKSYVTNFISLFFIADKSFTWLHKIKFSPQKAFFNKKEIKELIKQIDQCKKVVPVSSKKMCTILMPTVMPTLLRSLALGVNGKIVQKGSSPLKGKKNKRLLDKRITICDDAILKNGINSRPFDGEGVTSQKNTLFDKGVCKKYLYDLQTAGLSREKSTGNASRGFDGMPSPGMSNLVVSPGSMTVNEMVKDIKDGIIVHHILGGGQSNLLAGDFSCSVAVGFRIRNGKIIGRVKNTMLAGNVYEVMNNIAGIGKEVEGIGSFYTPAFYFKSMNVTGQ